MGNVIAPYQQKTITRLPSKERREDGGKKVLSKAARTCRTTKLANRHLNAMIRGDGQDGEEFERKQQQRHRNGEGTVQKMTSAW